MKRIHSFQLYIILFLFAVMLPIILPYFHQGYFPSHDGEWAVVRLADMYREVKDLQIPPRFSGNLNFGYGYPLFNFAYPLPYYIGLVFVFLKFGLVGSIKLLFLLSVLLSGIAMYFLSKEVWGSKLAGVISAILYAYFPYRLVDLFVRGSLGESLATVYFPLILFLIFKLRSGNKIISMIFIGISLAMLITTHNIMAVLFSLILLPVIFLLCLKDKLLSKYYLGSLLLGLGLSTYFWLPALLEKEYVALSLTPIANRDLYFVSLSQLFFSRWGFAPPTDIGGFTYQLGWPFIGVLITLIFIFIIHWKRKHEQVTQFHKEIAMYFFGLFLLLSCLLFSFSKPLWSLPLLSEINYPWTLLLPLAFLVSLLSGFLTRFPYTFKVISIILAVVAIVLYLPYAKPEHFVDRTDGFYLTNDATTTSSNELMPIWVKDKPLIRPQNAVEILGHTGEVTVIDKKSNKIVFSVTLSEDTVVQINTIYYPGWKIFVDNSPSVMSYNNPYGVMQLTLSKGNHLVTAVFSETPVRKISDSISLLSLVSIPLLFVLSRKTKII